MIARRSRSMIAVRKAPRIRAVGLVLFVAVVGLAWPASGGAYVYWANYDPNAETTIGRASLDGTGVNQSFITSTGGLIEIAVDGQHIYWPNTLAGTIGRANLDGTGVNQFFITGASDPEGLAVDGQHIYWTTYNGPGDTGIGRANLDGSAINNSFITGGDNPDWVAVDAQHIYWTNPSGNAIGRANLDGTSVDQSFISLPGVPGPDGVAVDGRHIYWTSGMPGFVGRANLDGSALDQSFIPTGDAHPVRGSGRCPACLLDEPRRPHSRPRQPRRLLPGPGLHHRRSHLRFRRGGRCAALPDRDERGLLARRVDVAGVDELHGNGDRHRRPERTNRHGRVQLHRPGPVRLAGELLSSRHGRRSVGLSAEFHPEPRRRGHDHRCVLGRCHARGEQRDSLAHRPCSATRHSSRHSPSRRTRSRSRGRSSTGEMAARP